MLLKCLFSHEVLEEKGWWRRCISHPKNQKKLRKKGPKMGRKATAM